MNISEGSIDEGLRALGIAQSAEAVSLLARHARLVYEANELLNLTSIDESDAVALHILDSAVALPFLAAAPPGEFADLGSGPGYPGIPLAIMSGRSVTLVESIGKKAAFLESASEELRLKATVRGVRAEELGLESPGRFAAVTARALSSLPSLVELAAPLLSRDGVLVCLKGRPGEDELERGDVVAKRCGLTREETASVHVSGVDAVRTIVTYRRVRASSVRLPRRVGLAQRKPLA